MSSRIVRHNSMKSMRLGIAQDHEARIAERTARGSPRSPKDALNDQLSSPWLQETVLYLRHFLEDPRSSPGSTAYHNVVAVTIAISSCVVLFETVGSHRFDHPLGTSHEYPTITSSSACPPIYIERH